MDLQKKKIEVKAEFKKTTVKSTIKKNKVNVETKKFTLKPKIVKNVVNVKIERYFGGKGGGGGAVDNVLLFQNNDNWVSQNGEDYIAFQG